MTKKILIIFASTVWLATGCGNNTAHENTQKATGTKAQEKVHKDNAGGNNSTEKSLMDKVTDVANNAKEAAASAVETVKEKTTEAVDKAKAKLNDDDDQNASKGKSLMETVTNAAKKAKEAATSTMETVKKKTSEAVDATKAAATSAVETVKEKAGEALDKAKEHLKGSAPETKTDTNKTLFDRITDTVHNAEETTQSLGTTAKVVNAVRKTLGD